MVDKTYWCGLQKWTVNYKKILEELAQLIRDGLIMDPIDARNKLVQLQMMDYAKQGKEARSSWE